MEQLYWMNAQLTSSTWNKLTDDIKWHCTPETEFANWNDRTHFRSISQAILSHIFIVESWRRLMNWIVDSSKESMGQSGLTSNPWAGWDSIHFNQPAKNHRIVTGVREKRIAPVFFFGMQTPRIQTILSTVAEEFWLQRALIRFCFPREICDAGPLVRK